MSGTQLGPVCCYKARTFQNNARANLTGIGTRCLYRALADEHVHGRVISEFGFKGRVASDEVVATGFGYQREDGVSVIPVGALGP